jgi:hypothetical protein
MLTMGQSRRERPAQPPYISGCFLNERPVWGASSNGNGEDGRIADRQDLAESGMAAAGQGMR